MGIGALSSGMALASVGQQVDVGVMKALQNLDKNVASELFASIGVGSGIDATA